MAQTVNVNLQEMKIKYKDRSETFSEEHLVSKEPIGQFKAWFDEVRSIPTILEPNAMCLSTADKNGIPSSRYVLLKEFGTYGFKFFTNSISRKGRELEENPNAALNFYWVQLNRQVRIEGPVEKVPDSDAVEYFEKRPYASRLSAAASEQSKVIPSREYLIERGAEIMEKNPNDFVPKPPTWSGYIVVPKRVEFWQGQTDRLHDRILFRKLGTDETFDPSLQHEGTDGWIYERLAP